MTRTPVRLRLASVLALPLVAATAALASLASPLIAQDPPASVQQAEPGELYTVEELDNLLAPVALYPDPILAQVLVAATYPDQIALAARYVRAYGTSGIDEQGWDVSVKAVAHYQPVLNMLAERPNWGTALGQAYAMQPGDVMASVQSLRRMARAQGNLVTTAEQRVEVEPAAIRIVPARPTVIYVPVYDPQVIYYQPVDYFRVRTPYWSFGVAFPIGVWLNYDCDWDRRVVYYHGWDTYGYQSSWYHASRPYIEINNIYVSPRRTVVIINRGVTRRHVDYDDFGRYNTVHRRVDWDRSNLPGRGYYGRTPKPYDSDKGRDNTVPTVARAAPRGDGGHMPSTGGRRPTTAGGERPTSGSKRPTTGGQRPPITGDRPNGDRPNGDRPDGRRGGQKDADRVVPVRIGGNDRPLYPPSEDLRPDRVKGNIARRESSPATSSGSWNARAPKSAREDAPSRGDIPSRARPLYTPVPRQDTYSAPRTRDREYSAPRTAARSPKMDRERSEPRSMPRSEPRSMPRSEPRSMPRSEPRSMPRSEPRSMPRSEPRSEPRSMPRGAERSAPSSSKPAKGSGRPN